MTAALTVVVLSRLAAADPVLEFDGVFGECRAVLAAVSDRLVVHDAPSRTSQTHVVPYRAGWEVPYLKRDGKTLVFRVGAIRVTKLGGEYHCPGNDVARLETVEVGDVFDYLHYVAEGYARVRIDGVSCDTFVGDRSEFHEVIEQPEVEAWIRVLYADGSSPGWLLYGGPQTRVAGVEC